MIYEYSIYSAAGCPPVNDLPASASLKNSRTNHTVPQHNQHDVVCGVEMLKENREARCATNSANSFCCCGLSCRSKEGMGISARHIEHFGG